MPFLKKCKTCDFTCSFNNDFRTAIKALPSFYVFVCLLEQRSEFPTQTSDQCYYAGVLLVQFLLLRYYVYSNIFPHFFLSLESILPTWAFTPVYHTRRMRVFAFNFNQLFYLFCYPKWILYLDLHSINWFEINSIMVLGKCLKFVNKMLRSIFVFFTIHSNKWFTLFKKIRCNNKHAIIFRSQGLMYGTV